MTLSRAALLAISNIVITLNPKGGCFLHLPEALPDRVKRESLGQLQEWGCKWSVKANGHALPDSAIEAGIRIERLLAGPALPDPLPAALIANLLDLALLPPQGRVLEPSAGSGAIVKALLDRGMSVVAIERDRAKAEMLHGVGAHALAFGPGGSSGELTHVAQDDFLSLHPYDLDSYAPDGFDAVIMTPDAYQPAIARADLVHVQHALGFIREGGTLVSLMGGGILYREDEHTARCKAQLITAGDVSFVSSPIGGDDLFAIVVVRNNRRV